MKIFVNVITSIIILVIVGLISKYAFHESVRFVDFVIIYYITIKKRSDENGI